VTEKTVITGKEAFITWAPPGCKWSAWVRPVPFILHDTCSLNQVMNFKIPCIFYVDELQSDTAFFIDMPGYESIKEGLALAKLGWQPIPLYNGTDEQTGVKALVDNHGIECALFWGADVLADMNIKKDAPPAFLLDSNRLHRHKPEASYFDNSWDLYSQDIPSVEYFLDSGIQKIVVKGEKIHNDLKRIFYKFQKKGIEILFTEGYETPQKIIIKKQKQF